MNLFFLVEKQKPCLAAAIPTPASSVRSSSYSVEIGFQALSPSEPTPLPVRGLLSCPLPLFPLPFAYGFLPAIFLAISSQFQGFCRECPLPIFPASHYSLPMAPSLPYFSHPSYQCQGYCHALSPSSRPPISLYPWLPPYPMALR